MKGVIVFVLTFITVFLFGLVGSFHPMLALIPLGMGLLVGTPLWLIAHWVEKKGEELEKRAEEEARRYGEFYDEFYD